MPVGAYTNPEKPVTASKLLVDGIEADLTAQVAAEKPGVEASKSYEEILKEAEIPLDEAQAVVDDILMKGYFEEIVKLTKKVSATLRTRSHSDFIKYHLAVEAHNPRYMAEVSELQIRYFLAGSLVRFGETFFSFPDKDKATEEEQMKAFESRLTWIEKQPERVIALLADKLHKFDKKIGLIMSEGIVENF